MTKPKETQKEILPDMRAYSCAYCGELFEDYGAAEECCIAYPEKVFVFKCDDCGDLFEYVEDYEEHCDDH